jgi:hypothetical protein
MLLIMEDYLDKDMEDIFKSVSNLSVVSFDFTNINDISEDFCNDFYQEYIWLVNPGTVYANSFVINQFKKALPDTVGTKNFIDKIEVK